MKNTITLFLLTLSLNCSSQVQTQELIEQTAQKIGIKNSDIYSELAISQELENGILIVIPEIAEEGDGYMIFNSNIILLNDKTGEVKAKFSGQKDWYFDAIAIKKIEIEPKLYQLNETTVGVGLNLYYKNQSRPNPYSSIEFSLYALEGNKLNRVLKDYPIKTFNGETDTTCKGEFEEHFKNMQVLDTYTNKLADLKFSNKIVLSEKNEDCETVKSATKKELEVLKYENGEYKNVL